MSRFANPLVVLVFALAALSGCDKAKQAVDGDPQATALNNAISANLGGADTCAVIADTASGDILYQYGLQAICMRPLPPCATFDIASNLIALDAGLATPQSNFKWNGQTQPITAWERDTDLVTGFRQSITWQQQALATQIGAERFGAQLKAYGYGSADPQGPVTAFWMGPRQGGRLTVSAREQVGFLHRLFTNALPARPEATAAVARMMASDAIGGVQVSGKTGTCESSPDGVHSVGWWVGRLQGPQRDVVFAAVMEGELSALPGAEVETRMRQVFTRVGYLPAQ